MKKSEFIEKYGEEAYQRYLERQKQYYQDHREEISECQRYYRQNHKEEISESKRRYYSTPWGRAVSIANSHRVCDRDRGFDISQNVDGQWIVDNVFSGQCCIYCGESDWRKLGVDRIDNNLPHIASNLVPCCYSCNASRQDIRTVQEQIEYINNKQNGDT